MFKIIFDRNSNEYDCGSMEANHMFIRSIEMYVNEVFKVRGYMYINDIYEMLGVGWNPSNENYCCIYSESNSYIDFNVHVLNDTMIEITVG